MSDRTLYCRCAFSDACDRAAKDEALRDLIAAGGEIDAVPDLCEMVARRDPALPALAAAAGSILACRERTVRWLLDSVGLAAGEDRDVALDGTPSFVVRLTGRPDPERLLALSVILLHAGLRVAIRPANDRPAADCEKVLPADRVDREDAERLVHLCRNARDAAGARSIGDWPPWFPVLDRDRCIDCGQCASFCLFGVYATDDDGTVRVVAPDHCKNLCPACARACPRLAIIFPKHGAAPIDGSEVLPEHFEQQHQDLERLKKQGVLDRLRQRRRKG